MDIEHTFYVLIAQSFFKHITKTCYTSYYLLNVPCGIWIRILIFDFYGLKELERIKLYE